MSKKYEDILFDLEFASRYAFIDCLKQLRLGNDQALVTCMEKNVRGLHDAILEMTTVDAVKMDIKVLRSLNQVLSTIVMMHPNQPTKSFKPDNDRSDRSADELGDDGYRRDGED